MFGEGFTIEKKGTGTSGGGGAPEVIAKTSNFVITTEDWICYTNEGASGAITFTLPTAAAGLTFFFKVVAEQDLTIERAGGDVLRYFDTDYSDLTGNNLGDTVKASCPDGDSWVIEHAVGLWDVNEILPTISTHPTLPNNLIRYYEMDEASWNGTPAEVVEATGNGSGGESGGATTTATNARFVRCGTSFNNNSQGWYGVTEPTTADYDFSGGVTVAFWCYPDTLTNMSPFSFVGTYNTNVQFLVSGAGLQAKLEGDPGSAIQSAGAAVSTGLLQHIIITHAGSNPGTAYIYVDNAQVATGSCNFQSAKTSDTLRMGSYLSFFWPFRGEIDEFGVWTRVLTSAERTDLYNAGAGLAYN